jgi:hypothetical protein
VYLNNLPPVEGWEPAEVWIAVNGACHYESLESVRCPNCEAIRKAVRDLGSPGWSPPMRPRTDE